MGSADISGTSNLFFVNTTFPKKFHPNSKKSKQDDDDKNDDLFFCIRHLLRFGRIIGLFPITGLFQSDPFRLTYR